MRNVCLAVDAGANRCEKVPGQPRQDCWEDLLVPETSVDISFSNKPGKQ